jgi:rubrerythrin
MSRKFDLSKLDLMDALDLAIIIEDDARERYEEFYRQIGTSGSNDAGMFFLQMSKNEAKHTEDLQALRKKHFQETKSRMNRTTLYEFQEIEAPEFDQAKSRMSVAQSLMVALDCEIKAFEFYNKTSTIVKNAEVKKFFEDLAKEEIEHQKMVREIMNKSEKTLSPEIDSDDIDEPNGL